MAGYKPPYTLEEQKKILRYIIDKKDYHSLRGRRFWQEMEQAHVVERTWQSAKEHFLKQLYPQLHNPRFHLTDIEIKLIKTGFIQSSKKDGKNLTLDGPETTRTVDLASFVDSSDEEMVR